MAVDMFFAEMNKILRKRINYLKSPRKLTKKIIKKVQKKKVYNTGDSQVVTHQGTNPARHCLTSVIR